MPRVNVYLPDSLHQAVKLASIPVSEVCQRALQAELARLRAEQTARQSILWADQTINGRP